MTEVTLAVRNVFRHRLRSFISIVAVAFGGAALIFIDGFLKATLSQMREGYIQTLTAHIQIAVKVDPSKPLEGDARLMPNPGELVQLAQSISGVAWATMRLGFPAVLSNGQATHPCYFLGVDPARSRYRLRANLNDRFILLPVDGALLDGSNFDPNDPYGILLGQGLAKSLDVKVGDNLTVMAGTVHGSLNANEFRVRGIYSSASKANDDHVARVSINLAQELFRTASADTVLIYLNRTEDTARVQKAVRDELRKRGYSYEVKNWFEVNDFYAKTEQLFSNIFTILKFVIAIVVVALIYNTVNMTVIERTAEVGTLAAMGANRADIRRLFILEGGVIGLIGAAIGILCGTALTLITAHYGIKMPPPPGGEFVWWVMPRLSAPGVLFAGCFSLFVTLCASVIPAHSASRLEIATALRRQS